MGERSAGAVDLADLEDEREWVECADWFDRKEWADADDLTDNVD